MAMNERAPFERGSFIFVIMMAWKGRDQTMRTMLTTFQIMAFLFILPVQGQGAILFKETFEDPNFASRGWYDNTNLQLSTVEHIPGSNHAVEYHFLPGAQTPAVSGGAIRRKFAETDSVYISYYVKHSSSWVGSNQSYHPHEFFLLTNLDDDYWGPSTSHLTAYVEENAGKLVLAIQDALNINETKIGVDLTNITEQRAVAGCNGYNRSDGSEREDCYTSGNTHRNDKVWKSSSLYFQDGQGPYYKGDWHHIEAYFALNSIEHGKGVANGTIQYWYDGVEVINHNNVLIRTGQYPKMKFNQLLVAPYIGDGSPVDQTIWIDDLTVATSRPTGTIPDNTVPSAPQNIHAQ
jgi:hypothetical protein